MMNFLQKIKASKPTMISLAAVGVVIVLFLALIVYTYAYGGIFPGVKAGNLALSGKSETQAAELIMTSCDEGYKNAEVKVAVENFDEVTIKGSELDITVPAEEIAKRAYGVGREGGFFSRIGAVMKCIFGGYDVGAAVNFGEEAFEEAFLEVSKYDIAPVDAEYTIEDTTLILHPRHDGNMINKDEFREKLTNAFLTEDYSTIALSRELATSVALDIDKVYSEVHTEVRDAYLEKGEDGNKIIPHVLGVDFDLEAARIAYNKTPDEIIRIPLEITQPKIQTKHLETNLFKYCLAEVETHFSPKKVERTANVRLAAQLVNGTILNPGEEFSYNKTVGPRTTARGFKAAAIFAQGEVVDGIGGGICQVSSTIYMAALRANMKITERRNHAFYVDYTPKGEDATVVYGSIDFRFVNTSEYPVKIVATSKNNYIRVKIMGTEPDEKVTVKLTKKTHSTSAYPTREKTSTALAKGVREVQQKGQQGISMSVYRNVYDAKGKLIESYLENNSKYKPMPEIVLVGTGAAKPTVAPAPSEEKEDPPKEETPTQTPTENAAPETPSAETPDVPPVDAPVDEPPAEEKPAEEKTADESSETPDWITQ
ncbi:MAG: VanW family protein [Oscillospiraceae bacterium]|nr:VanW family protein [Oscillospiraceae bacterium]